LRFATILVLALLLDDRDFATLRGVDFAAIALFAFGRAALDFNDRLLTDDPADRRAGRDVDRRRPFVTELLIRS
jgi:hypothetical protein